MDTSEQYIKMRMAAIPDMGVGIPQELAPGAEITWLTTFVFVDRIGNVYYCGSWKTYQLERQDQLQEMSGLTWALFDRACIEPEFNFSTTKELAGIQVVMNEKYGKKWCEDKWETV